MAEAALKPDDREIIKRYYYLAEMNYRTMGQYREDGSTMTDAEFMERYEEVYGSLEDFVKAEKARKLAPFGGALAVGSPGGEPKKKGGHHDFSDR